MREPETIIIGDKTLSDILGDPECYLNGKGGKSPDLRYADLTGANLSGTNLTNADLSGACLSYAYLRSVNLYHTNLRGAELINTNLSNAYLRCADLSNANLTNADLSGANLTNANLSGAKLNGANLKNVTGFYLPYTCPDYGKFIGWKKALSIRKDLGYELLVELEIPEDAKRLSATGRKCRCNKAKVLSIRDLSGNILNEATAFSFYDNGFIYKVGETVSVSDFDENRWNECSTGIHFFINRQEAINFNY